MGVCAHVIGEGCEMDVYACSQVGFTKGGFHNIRVNLLRLIAWKKTTEITGVLSRNRHGNPCPRTGNTVTYSHCRGRGSRTFHLNTCPSGTPRKPDEFPGHLHIGSHCNVTRRGLSWTFLLGLLRCHPTIVKYYVSVAYSH